MSHCHHSCKQVDHAVGILQKLPIELRLNVYDFTFPRRTYEFSLEANVDIYVLRGLKFPPPLIAHVCHEIRDYALQKYNKIAFDYEVFSRGPGNYGYQYEEHLIRIETMTGFFHPEVDDIVVSDLKPLDLEDSGWLIPDPESERYTLKLVPIPDTWIFKKTGSEFSSLLKWKRTEFLAWKRKSGPLTHYARDRQGTMECISYDVATVIRHR